MCVKASELLFFDYSRTMTLRSVAGSLHTNYNVYLDKKVVVSFVDWLNDLPRSKFEWFYLSIPVKILVKYVLNKVSRHLRQDNLKFSALADNLQGVKLALAKSHLRPFLRLGDQNLDHQSPRWRVRYNPYMFVCQFFLSSPTQFWLKSWSVRCFNAFEVVYRIFSAFTKETTMFTCWQGRVVFSYSLGKVMWFSKVLSCGGTWLRWKTSASDTLRNYENTQKLKGLCQQKRERKIDCCWVG